MSPASAEVERNTRSAMAGSEKLLLTTYRCGEGTALKGVLRIGAVRFLPRGVKKEDYRKKGYFDVWLPILSPEAELIKEFRKDPRAGWKEFSRKYEKQILSSRDARAVLSLLKETAKHTPVAIGCYCEDESLCHRSILKRLIEEAE